MKERGGVDKWEVRQLIDFLGLTNDAALSGVKQPIDRLLKAYPDRRLPEHVVHLARLGSAAKYRQLIFAHPIAKWLDSSPHFRKAFATFESARKKEKTGPLVDPFLWSNRRTWLHLKIRTENAAH